MESDSEFDYADQVLLQRNLESSQQQPQTADDLCTILFGQAQLQFCRSNKAAMKRVKLLPKSRYQAMRSARNQGWQEPC